MSLTDLDAPILVRIMGYLAVDDVVGLARTCTRLRAVADSDDVWARRCRRLHVPKAPGLPLKASYVATYFHHRDLLNQLKANQVRLRLLASRRLGL
jgi:hypothetical protein